MRVSGAAATPAEVPHVAVLVLNWNGWRDTVECLESILRMDYPRLSVVVCDNGSTDRSVDEIRAWASGRSVPGFSTPSVLRHLVEPRVPKPIAMLEISRAASEAGGVALPEGALMLIHNDANLGFAAGNNVGLRFLALQETIKYVWILNNDIVTARDALSELVGCAEETGHVGGVGGTIYEYVDPDTVESAAGGLFPPWKGLSIPVQQVTYRPMPDGNMVPALDYLSGGCMLVSMAMIAMVGLIDESYFMYGEDVDYSFRIRRAGYLLAYAPQASVWHKGGGTIGHRSSRHDYYIVRNSLHIAQKYHPRMLPVATLYVAYKCAIPKIVRRQWGRLSVLRRAYRDFRAGVFGAPPILPGE